jgi:hypothetical protein
MKRKTSPTQFLDKTIWNPRPVIDLASRAIKESGGSFLLVLGETFSELLTNNELLTNAVGTRGTHVAATVEGPVWPVQVPHFWDGIRIFRSVLCKGRREKR